MQENNVTSVRAVLEQMTTEQLDELLNSELEKERADGDSVRMILSVLWEREKDAPIAITPKTEKEWTRYKNKIAKLNAEEKRIVIFRRWGLRVASAAAVLCLLIFAIPQEVGADNLFGKLARLTDAIVEFFSPGLGNDNLTQYEFRTDNPDLQQVYGAVVEIGITDPVVPMWLPSGYELTECELIDTPNKKGVMACFMDGDNGVVFKAENLAMDISHRYHKDDTEYSTYEKFEIDHNVFRNNDRWVVIWFNGETECSITIDCQEDTLYTILDSIYDNGGNR